MPELPEVETVTKILRPLILEKKIVSIDVLRKQTIVGDPIEFKSSLSGETFKKITRIGKYIIFHFTNNKVMISHLRMEGKYYILSEKENNTYYSRVVFHLDDGNKICYDDSRCFGIMILSDENNYTKEKEIAKLGPEPFAVNDVEFLLKRCKNKRLPIKTTLLDQSLMTGLGNIYVDEVLFASKIHPLTPANKISKSQWINIVNNAKAILTKAIEAGGSTIKSYHPGKDIDGKFQSNLKVYGRSGEKCFECDATLRFLKIGGRGTTFCPKCQIKKGGPMFIAITGKIASGKSTAINAFRTAKIPTISCDEIVANLYQNSTISDKLSKILHISFNAPYVDKDILRKHLILHKEDKRKVERFIHPLVKKEIVSFLKGPYDPIKVVEVPLLFETGLDQLFDTIIVIDINEDKQLELLENRDKEKALLLKEINKSNKIEANKSKAAYIIENNSSLNDFENKVNKIICILKENLN